MNRKESIPQAGEVVNSLTLHTSSHGISQHDKELRHCPKRFAGQALRQCRNPGESGSNVDLKCSPKLVSNRDSSKNYGSPDKGGTWIPALPESLPREALWAMTGFTEQLRLRTESYSGSGLTALLVGLMLVTGNAWAEESSSHHSHTPATEESMDMSGMDMPGMDMSDMDMSGMDMGSEGDQPMDHNMDHQMNHEMNHDMSHEMNHTDHSAMQHDTSATGLRDPHAWADGYGFGPIMRPHLHDEHPMAGIMVERLEALHEEHSSFSAYDLRAWYGYTYDRAIIKAEGEVDNGKLQDSTTELLWSHAIAPFWNSQIGTRHDMGTEPNRNWLALGVEGLTPYWFEIDATAYLGTQGRSAATVTAEYELLLTQRLILQPRLEANLYSKRDDERMHGTGLTDATAGVRLRYEIRREFAPYVGIEWVGKLGNTAEMARNAGMATNEQRIVAGLRFWF